MKHQLRAAVVMTAALVVITGGIYPLIVTGASQVLFHDKANGSMIKRDGQVVGSTYIGQSYTVADPADPEKRRPDPRYFQSRPSAAGAAYDPMASGASNLGPTNPVLRDRIKESIAQIAAFEGVDPSAIPADAVFASASGLDPDISPTYAALQVPRIARTRGLSEDVVRSLVKDNTAGRQFGILGEARVNVLKLNLALDAAKP